MFLHLDEWPWLLNIYKARLLQICYLYQLHFDFLVPFTLLLIMYSATMYHDYCTIEIWISFFFMLMSGRPLSVTTFFVFSRPLCSHFAVQIVIWEFSAPRQQHCLSLSQGFPLQRQTAKICYCCSQPLHSWFVELLEVILQRCSSAGCFVWVIL